MRELASLKKAFYSLLDLCEIFLGCNQGNLSFPFSPDDKRR